MTKKYWIKLWVEIIGDVKMARLSDHLWRRAVECFLLAADEHGGDDEGLLPNLMDMAFYLRADEDKLEDDLDALVKAELLVNDAGGRWKVKNFKKRQEARTNTERVQMYRERQRSMDETPLEREGNEDETEEKRDGESYLSSVSPLLSVSDSVFISSFRSFNGDREKKRWYALVEVIGEKKAREIAAWAEKKEIHMTNRGGLLDSMETAAKTWGEKKGKDGKSAVEIRGNAVKAKVDAFLGRTG